jgi:hypothetical protein
MFLPSQILFFVALHLPKIEKNCFSLPCVHFPLLFVLLCIKLNLFSNPLVGGGSDFNSFTHFVSQHNLFICMWQSPDVTANSHRSFTCRIYRKLFRSFLLLLLFLLLLVHCVMMVSSTTQIHVQFCTTFNDGWLMEQ